MLLDVVADGLMEVAEEGFRVLELFKLPAPVPTPLGLFPKPEAVPRVLVPTPEVVPMPEFKPVPLLIREEPVDPLTLDEAGVVVPVEKAEPEVTPIVFPPAPVVSAPPAPTPWIWFVLGLAVET
jgi:hypothetical protein